MAYLNVDDAFSHLQDRTLEGIRAQFDPPIKGKNKTLHLIDLSVEDNLHSDDIRSQQKAKMSGETWGPTVFGTFEVRDNLTGTVVEKKRIRVAEIPKTTQRYSYIVNGQEYQVDNQWQLKPGVYTRRRANGELEAHFNTPGKGVGAFKMKFEPDSQRFLVEYKKAKSIPAYPLLQLMGVKDEELEKSWGKEVLEANKKSSRSARAVEQFYKTNTGVAASSPEVAETYVKKALLESALLPDITEVTLGKAYDNVSGEALHAATKKLLAVQKGAPEDDRDSLAFKTLRSAGDFVRDKIQASRWRNIQKIQRQLNNPKTETVREVVRFNYLNEPVRRFFTDGSISNPATQINPLQMVSTAMQTTIMGPGGIKSERGVSDEAKMINPSHLGFLDPIHSPEGAKTGVTLRLPMGIKKKDNDAVLSAYNLHTGKQEDIGIVRFMKSRVVLPDQVTWKDGKPSPVGHNVRMVNGESRIEDSKFSGADYVLRDSSQLFNITSNLIPFMGNDSGGRAGMASRHMEQAVSLEERQAPLVQVSTGVNVKGIETFEKLLGHQSSHRSPVDGKITKVGKDAIHIVDHAGKSHEVQLYNNYPLNDVKSVMHSTPVVKVGDEVKAKQLVADTNFSKDGTLALGTTLRVGYVPYKGYNYEDGIVISDSAAKRLSSVHLHKPSLYVEDNTIFSPKKYSVSFPTTFKANQYDKLDDKGVVKIGQKVKPGDPLILAMRPFEIKDRSGFAAVRKSHTMHHLDNSVRWDSDFEGEVVDVHHLPDKVVVHVKTTEPMQIGDKLCFDEETEVLTSLGWKPVGALSMRDRICTLHNGRIQYQEPTALHAYESGGRMYKIESQQVDLLVTEEHRMYAKRRRNRDWELIPAKALFGERISYKKDGHWDGPAMPEMSFPPMTVPHGGRGSSVRLLPELRMSGATYLMLLGAFLSEGSSFDEGTHGSGIDFAQTKPAGRASFHAALTKAGVKFCESKTKFRIYSKQLYAHFSLFGWAKYKFIPEHLFEYSKKDLKILFKWLMWGDGHAKPNGRPVNYTTTSKQLADDVQRLCLHIGYAANISFTPSHAFKQNGREYIASDRYSVRVVTTKLTPQVNHGHVKEQKAQKEEWVEDHKGPVFCVTVPSHVLYVRRNGKPVWSGNSNRHGAKGIVTLIQPDEEMPHTKDGKHVEVLLNPVGVGGRMNVGQILETAASKIAEKTGHPYLVRNFDPSVGNVLDKVKKDLKDHHLSESEELIDPQTKLSIGKALVGPQYMLKLVHQVEKKLSVRSGMNLPGMPSEERYDSNLQPGGGGASGGQRLGALGFYSLLAHGSKAIIREMQTWKSEGHDSSTNEQKRWPSQHLAVWAAIQEGTPLPVPKTTFAFHRFTNMLRGAGINIEKKGHEMVLSPLTDKQILKMSGGELVNADKSPVRAKEDKAGELVPMPGGLFDEKATGGHGGTKFSHLSLAEPLPNPVFEKAIRNLTGLKGKEFDSIVFGDQAVNAKTGKLVPLKEGVTGGAGIKALLDRIDVKADLAAAQKELAKSPVSKSDNLLKRVKYLRALQQLELSPSEAYILHNLPIVPPVIRPLTVMQNGGLKYEDVNGLYKQFDMINKNLKDPILSANLTDNKKKELRTAYYDGVKALMGVGTINKDAKERGFLDQIAGEQPKKGYFQNILMNRRQDMTMRSTIIPEPSLGLDEVGLPKDAALTLFRPFVIRQLVLQGAAPSAIQAQKLVAAVHKGGKDPMVWRALDHVMDERPILLKRDPMLHKYSIQAFKAKTVEGNAIKIHPLVTGGLNADFDGDTCAVFVPISHDAVVEARKMFPSNNVFNEASGHVMYQPTLESALGLYKLSVHGADTKHHFETKEAVAEALAAKKVQVSDGVFLNGKKTTPGRVLLSSVLPEDLQAKVLHDFSFHMDKKGLTKTLAHVGKDHPHDFGRIADGIKDLGYGTSFGVIKTPLVKAGHVSVGTHSFSLEDFNSDEKVRADVLKPTQTRVDAINAGGGSQAEKDRKSVGAWLEADKEIKRLHTENAEKNPSNLYMLTRAGIKPSWDQYKQMVLAPGIFKDSANNDIPLAITRNYSEGLDVGSYWTQLYGARRGAVMKTQEVEEPGALSKLLMNTSMSTLVEKHDCGTRRGMPLSVNDQDIHDRYLVNEFKSGGAHVPAGTLLTPAVIGKIRSVDKEARLLVRSPLKCEAEHGICQKCLGISVDGHEHQLGTNIGVISAQSLGERAVQLMLKNFHGGGVAETGGGTKVINSFDLFKNLTELPAKIPNAASLAMVSGKIDKVEHTDLGANVFINGKPHFVGRDTTGHALNKPLAGTTDSDWDPPVVGMHVEAGQSLSDPSRTTVNPHDLYRATGSMDTVQNHLVGEMAKIYEGQGIKRRMLETVVKAMSNLTKVVDPGDDPYVLRGEFHPTSVIKHRNETELKDKLPILHRPVLQGVNMLPLSIQEDWMAKLQHRHLKDTLLEAASQGLSSDLHGSHPVPGGAYGAEFGLPPADQKHHY